MKILAVLLFECQAEWTREINPECKDLKCKILSGGLPDFGTSELSIS